MPSTRPAVPGRLLPPPPPLSPPPLSAPLLSPPPALACPVEAWPAADGVVARLDEEWLDDDECVDDEWLLLECAASVESAAAGAPSSPREATITKTPVARFVLLMVLPAPSREEISRPEMYNQKFCAAFEKCLGGETTLTAGARRRDDGGGASNAYGPKSRRGDWRTFYARCSRGGLSRRQILLHASYAESRFSRRPLASNTATRRLAVMLDFMQPAVAGRRLGAGRDEHKVNAPRQASSRGRRVPLIPAAAMRFPFSAGAVGRPEMDALAAARQNR